MGGTGGEVLKSCGHLKGYQVLRIIISETQKKKKYTVQQHSIYVLYSNGTKNAERFQQSQKTLRFNNLNSLT